MEGVTIYSNKDPGRHKKVTWHDNLTISDIVRYLRDYFHIKHTDHCRLFDSTGTELWDDDLEYVNIKEYLFLSKGEDFNKRNCLMMYEKIRLLGKGGFGTVKLYRHKITNREVAIKFLKVSRLSNSQGVGRIYREIQVLRNQSHSHIVQLYEVLILDDYICIVMEYCAGGELKTYLKQKGPLSEDEAYDLSIQLCDAVRYCHSSNIIHRDLKPQNILFKDDSHTFLKICDFGIAGIAKFGNWENSTAGSLWFLAPEVVSSQDTSPQPSIDVWSIGCIFYSFFTGQSPFAIKNRSQCVQNIIKGEYSPLPRSISRPWRKLIKNCLRVSRTKRWDLWTIIEHLWKYRSDPQASLSESSEEEQKRHNRHSLSLPRQPQKPFNSALQRGVSPKGNLHKRSSQRVILQRQSTIQAKIKRPPFNK